MHMHFKGVATQENSDLGSINYYHGYYLYINMADDDVKYKDSIKVLVQIDLSRVA